MHWPNLPTFEAQPGTMRYWPRGSATHSGPIYLTVAQVNAENAIWDAAYAQKIDVTWSEPFTVAERTMTRADKAALMGTDDAEDVDEDGDENELVFAEPVVSVYRPDFLDKNAPS